jgi:hypothetical protein
MNSRHRTIRAGVRLMAAVAWTCALVGECRADLSAWLGPPVSLPAPFAPAPAVLAPHQSSDRPHPAVARIIVPEGDATSYGSGTLIDVRDQFGLVITNWHVVRDGTGEVEVVFPDGYRSMARPLKVDEDWDLAALVIWRPTAAPVSIAAQPPQPGDQLTICGYGQGQYRAATGRCTKYYAPKLELPLHMVELDVEARQGDSGGPIFNDRGELAGVLFGAGGGTTLGSFGGQVQSFLASLAPDIGRGPGETPRNTAPAASAAGVRNGDGTVGMRMAETSAHSEPMIEPTAMMEATVAAEASRGAPAVDRSSWQSSPGDAPAAPAATAPAPWFDVARNVLAAVGVIAIVVQMLRAAG